jgi:hypothetical protein
MWIYNNQGVNFAILFLIEYVLANMGVSFLARAFFHILCAEFRRSL